MPVHYIAHAQADNTLCGKRRLHVREKTSNVIYITCPQCKTHPRFMRIYMEVVKNMQSRHHLTMVDYAYAELDSRKEKKMQEEKRLTIGTFESTGEFRVPKLGEFVVSASGENVIQLTNKMTRSNPKIIMMRKVSPKVPLTSWHLIQWLNGYTSEALRVECFACGCDGTVGSVYTRTAPNDFEYISFYHEENSTAFASMREGAVVFEDDIEGSIFIHRD